VKLIIELQKLASLMFFGNKNILDPSEAMKAIIDSQGRLINKKKSDKFSKRKKSKDRRTI